MARSKSSAIMALLAVVILAGPMDAADTRRVKMAVSPPSCDFEVTYKRTYEDGERSETYAVYARKIGVKGETAYQSISVYPDRVRRITMRGRDLTPLYMAERWNQGDSLIERTYGPGTVHMIRRGLPYPMDETVEVPPGVHDPESFAFLLKGYPFEDQNSVAPIDVLVAEPNPIYNKPIVLGVLIRPLGEETITTPAGTFDCYVLEMGLAGVLGYIAPENRFWLLKEDPHMIVRAGGAGEMVEFMGGPFTCDGAKHCPAPAEPPP